MGGKLTDEVFFGYKLGSWEILKHNKRQGKVKGARTRCTNSSTNWAANQLPIHAARWWRGWYGVSMCSLLGGAFSQQ